MSEGWTGIKVNSCWDDKDIVPPVTFYYHAETDAIPTGDGKTNTWRLVLVGLAADWRVALHASPDLASHAAPERTRRAHEVG